MGTAADDITELLGADSIDVALPRINGIIDRFSVYMSTLPDPVAAAPLSNPEKALLRTFLIALIREKI